MSSRARETLVGTEDQNESDVVDLAEGRETAQE